MEVRFVQWKEWFLNKKAGLSERFLTNLPQVQFLVFPPSSSSSSSREATPPVRNDVKPKSWLKRNLPLRAGIREVAFVTWNLFFCKNEIEIREFFSWRFTL